MLGPGFPEEYLELCRNEYVAPIELISLIQSSNLNFDTGHETRLQSIYGEELWKKIESAGLFKENLFNCDVLEVCAGTGFLTYHLLKHVNPASLTINDISENEIKYAKILIGDTYPNINPQWVIGDIHLIDFNKKFDVIIGHSFIHHFYDVPLVLNRIFSLLKPGGVFISTGEPTYLSPIIEGRKFYLWPLAIFMPKFFLRLIRKYNKAKQFGTDVWVFDPKKLKVEVKKAGFNNCKMVPFNLVRNISNTIFGLNLSKNKMHHSKFELRVIQISIMIDSFLAKILPIHAFAHFTLSCRK
jgi:ubiquinone/menaquinone biosynthesis C-methylase UbiE